MKNEFGKIDKKTFLLMQVSALVFSLSNVFSKFASFEPLLSLKFVVLYAGSLLVLVVYAVMWQNILAKVPLITAYSNRLLSMVWGVIWGVVIFNESISLKTIIGTAVILYGLYIVVRADE